MSHKCNRVEHLLLTYWTLIVDRARSTLVLIPGIPLYTGSTFLTMSHRISCALSAESTFITVENRSSIITSEESTFLTKVICKNSTAIRTLIRNGLLFRADHAFDNFHFAPLQFMILLIIVADPADVKLSTTWSE